MKKSNKYLTIILSLTPPILVGIAVGIYSLSALKPTGLNDYGTINNGDLSVSAFKTYVEKLGFNKFNRLSLLKDQELNQKLANEYPEATVKITKGTDEATGTLILQFSVHDKNNNIVSGTSTITGFETYDYENVNLQDIKVNFSHWFDKQLPIKKQTNSNIDISEINKNNLIDLIASANLATWKNNQSTLVPLKQALSGWQGLKAQLISKSSNKDYLLQLQPLTINLKQFDGNKWISSKTKDIIDNTRKSTNFPIPTLSDLKDHMLGQINIKPNADYTNYYPSYFQSKWEASKEIADLDFTQLMDFTNFSEIEKKYDHYLNQTPKTNLSFKVDTTSYDGLNVNDYQGTLDFRMQLKEEGKNSAIKTKNFQLSKMKKISDFIDQKKQQTNNFEIFNDSNFNFYEKVLSVLKTKQIKEEVIRFFDGSEHSHSLKVDDRELKAALKSISTTGLFFKADDDKPTWEQKSQKIGQWNDLLWLFNQSLSVNNSNQNTVNDCILNNKDQGTIKEPNLYICNNNSNNAFYLDHFQYSFDETGRNKILLTLTKTNNSDQINISFTGKTIVGFSDINRSDEQFNTVFWLNNFSKSELS